VSPRSLISSRFRRPAHSNCNINYKNSFYIPIVFHNLSGYAHFIIKEIIKEIDDEHVDVLPITKKKYILFTKHVNSTKDEKNFQKNCVKLRFNDSFKFLNTSLHKLTSYLNKAKLTIVHSEFSILSDEEFELFSAYIFFYTIHVLTLATGAYD